MHIQPNSRSIRSFIPPERFFNLMAEERSRSFIGLSLQTWAAEQIQVRIAELEKREASGFMYLGEKNWLLDYSKESETSGPGDYATWVKDTLRDHLQLSFQKEEGYLVNVDAGTVWKAELDTQGLLLSFPELAIPAFEEVDDLEVYVLGDEQGPSPAHLIQAFAFLHTLEYALSTFSAPGKGHHPVGITGIDLTNTEDPGRWELNVISEYGAEWDLSLVDGRVWRKGS